MKTKLAVIGLVASLAASPALAWGDREQGALAGIAGLLLLQRLNQQQPYPHQAPPVHLPVHPVPPIYSPYPPAPIIIPQCRQVLAIQIDRWGNEYRYPVTVCN